MGAEQPWGIYVHTPFCLEKCFYCDFPSFPVPLAPETREALFERYTKALLRELELAAQSLGQDLARLRPAVSVYFGGGTPSLLGAGRLAQILARIQALFPLTEQAEITLEVNPATVDAAGLSQLRQVGFNRLSIGVQSLQDAQLALLGRLHSAQEAREVYAQARRAGFDNISLDLIMAQPGQSLSAWQEDVQAVLALAPEHLSLYSLIIEEGTAFWPLYAQEQQSGEAAEAQAARGEELCMGQSSSEDLLAKVPSKPSSGLCRSETCSQSSCRIQRPRKPCYRPLPSPETERQMYYWAQEALKQAGYGQYEISNWAQEGRRAVHNSLYWQGGAYLGFGAAAASYWQGWRSRHLAKPRAYMCAVEGLAKTWPQGLDEERDKLSLYEQMQEFFLLGFRCLDGCQEAKFLRRFEAAIPQDLEQALAALQEEGLLFCRAAEDSLRQWTLSPKGLDFANQVFMAFV